MYMESILADCGTLGADNTKVTYTSDYFPQMLDLAERLIRSGHLYADDTPQERMKEVLFVIILLLYSGAYLLSLRAGNFPSHKLGKWITIMATSHMRGLIWEACLVSHTIWIIESHWCSYPTLALSLSRCWQIWKTDLQSSSDSFSPCNLAINGHVLIKAKSFRVLRSESNLLYVNSPT